MKIALNQIGPGVQRKGMLFLCFNTFDDDQRAKISDDLDNLWQNSARAGIDHGLNDQRAVQLDDVGCQPPQTIEIRVLTTEIVNGDAKAAFAVALDRCAQVPKVLNVRFEDLKDDLRWLQPAVTEQLFECRPVAGTDAQQVAPAHVEVEIPLGIALREEIDRMHHPAQAIEIDRLFGGDCNLECLGRRYFPAIRTARPQQGFVRNRIQAIRGEYRLEYAVQTQPAIAAEGALIVKLQVMDGIGLRPVPVVEIRKQVIDGHR
ncbi:MAG: hypothetical protein QM739_16735 [Propionivibrio sp.]